MVPKKAFSSRKQATFKALFYLRRQQYSIGIRTIKKLPEGSSYKSQIKYSDKENYIQDAAKNKYQGTDQEDFGALLFDIVFCCSESRSFRRLADTSV